MILSCAFMSGVLEWLCQRGHLKQLAAVSPQPFQAQREVSGITPSPWSICVDGSLSCLTGSKN